MSALIDLTGQRFGRLVVVKRYGTSRTDATWKCKCDCGMEFVTLGKSLRNGHTLSCGCLRSQKSKSRGTTHGLSKTRMYKYLLNIKHSCAYLDKYISAGITICDEWKDFMKFYDWAMKNGYSDDKVLERIDPNGSFEPGNCRWVEKQNINSHKKKG